MIKICKHSEFPLKDFKGKVIFIEGARENKPTDYQYIRTISKMGINGLSFKGTIGINVEYEEGTYHRNDGNSDPE